jgi:uncharacterized membrane protein (GlpM family)
MVSKTEMTLQFVLGGLAVVGQTYFANAASPFLAGLIYSAPVLMLPAAYFTHTTPNLRKMALTGGIMILASVAYDVGLWYLLGKGYSKGASLVLAFIPWLPVALATGWLGVQLADRG